MPVVGLLLLASSTNIPPSSRGFVKEVTKVPSSTHALLLLPSADPHLHCHAQLRISPLVSLHILLVALTLPTRPALETAAVKPSLGDHKRIGRASCGGARYYA